MIENLTLFNIELPITKNQLEDKKKEMKENLS